MYTCYCLCDSMHIVVISLNFTIRVSYRGRRDEAGRLSHNRNKSVRSCVCVCVIVSVMSLLFFVDTSILISTTVSLDIAIMHNTHSCVCLHKSGTMLSAYLVPEWWNGLMNYPLSIYNSNFLMSRLVRRLTTKHTRHTLEYWMLIFHQIDR